ncbi:MAG: TPM domain-containing protein [Crocinitomicaceae bacterium]|nr:TPM domain-containing protein [Crocinitomicaceae bacterium]
MMKNKLNTLLRLSFLILFSIAANNLIAQRNKSYSPKDLPVPVLDSTGFIIDPGGQIETKWKKEMIGTRETYFFCRYVEPICVRVDNISNPESVEEFANQLVELWDLEEKTNGRFVFQLHCKSKKTVVFKIGSRLKSFYKTAWLRDLARETADVHLIGDATGTGDFVSMQKLGDHIFQEIAFDSKLSTYDNNTGIHSIYPDAVEKSHGELITMTKSWYSDGNSIFIDQPSDEYVQNEYVPKFYFEGLTPDEIEANNKRINKNGIFTDINSVPNAREKDNTHVTDPHQILPDYALDMINQFLKELEDSLGYQVAVICANSIGENDPHTFGTELFNEWGVGNRKTQNGLVILLVIDQHAVEFITGRGTEGILTDGDCYDIQQNEMVPYFKKDDYVTGMIRGVQATCDFFYGSPPIYTDSDLSSDEDYTYDDYDYYDDYVSEPFNFFESGFWNFYVLLTISMSSAWLLVLIIAMFIADLHKRYHVMKFFTLTIWMFIIPVPFVLIYFITKALMEKWRNTIRFSPQTGEEMHKLGDQEEDKHLSKGQISEEKVKSIDYDVWITYGAKDVLILSYKKWFSKHSKCPKCSYKTYFKLYDKTISAATYSSSGTGERCYKCENCGFSKTERYTIPMKTRSSSSSGGSSSGGYSRSYSSGGGSSYGGGSSRGGGAGSRW